MLSFELCEPHTLEDAFDLLGHDDPGVRPMGGGTALMLMMKAQMFKPMRLVSLRRIAPFSGLALSEDGARLRIGAMATFSEIEHSDVVRRHFPAVVQAMKTLANVRVRNVASVGGNLAHADPHLDLPPLWMAHDATARLVSKNGERVIPVAEIFRGYYETSISDGELISEICVPLREGWRSTYAKITTRAIHDWPALGIAVSLQLEGGVVRDLRIVLSAALDKPTRLRAAEEVLRGGEVDEVRLRRAGEAAVAEVEIHSDSRGSASYKNHLLRVHLARALQSVIGG
ncbi:xanthine dehydrogenase family protein subunit M [Bradyrhizobium sp. CCGB12]|uniref:FAD binding domain-containing protein n=1 Tax=Bradyrhizobium sp. CCGB12 TaxID=2949632 RepID=UPI0020B2261D|nr:xanthine dehydrogenase family protein subunit M [Bradyrhizobium sp. CCGB12]MCP3387757.1 xanthine dehydrogenase family protein subunit M [Bradyrhizobium sp. CCGB12]